MSEVGSKKQKETSQIALYRPLSCLHTSLGPLSLVALSDRVFTLKCVGDRKVEPHRGELKVLTEKEGEPFFFEGFFEASAQENCLDFSFDSSRYRESVSKLLIKLRKNQHIDICNKEDVESSTRFTGFEKLSFLPKALPELDQKDLCCETSFLGKKFSYPFFITGMTGGVQEGQRINENLAEAACAFGIPMGIGSQRMALEHPEYSPIFEVKEKYPELFLIGNVGFSDLLKEKDPVSFCQRAIEMVKADAFAIHLNVVQECVQKEGNKEFKGFYKLLENLSASLEQPLILKEVGCGISPEVAKRIEDSGVKALDVGGLGGTSWSQVESFRVSQEEGRLGRSFRDWGIPTAYSLAGVKELCSRIEVTATGGIRDGQTVAKASALGASMCGIGLPLFKAAMISAEEVKKELQLIATQLEVTMLATGSRSLQDLRKSLVLGTPQEKNFYSYLERLGIERVR